MNREYFQENYQKNHRQGKMCKHCNSEFWPETPSQQFCSREENPSCHDDRINKKLWNKNKHYLQKENI